MRSQFLIALPVAWKRVSVGVLSAVESASAADTYQCRTGVGSAVGTPSVTMPSLSKLATFDQLPSRSLGLSPHVLQVMGQ